MNRKKLAHQLDTPFSEVHWPTICQDDQEAILELLLSLLFPLGEHRRNHILPSKGKRRKADKKREPSVGAHSRPVGTPLAPELGLFVDVGLANISRALEKMSSSKLDGVEVDDGPASRPYWAVFIARGDQPTVFSAHFPQMVAAASRGRDPIRLVGFSKTCEDRLSTCLSIPRASSIAIRLDAPRSEALVSFVNERVPVIEVPWLKEAQDGRHLDTRIVTTETVIGPKRQKRG